MPDITYTSMAGLSQENTPQNTAKNTDFRQ